MTQKTEKTVAQFWFQNNGKQKNCTTRPFLDSCIWSFSRRECASGDQILPVGDSLWRFQHSLIRMDEVVLAFGGLDKDNSTSAKIKVFNQATKSWENHDRNLTTKNAEELLVVPFPTSSLDCAFECQCGRRNSMGNTRIFDGSNTQVNSHFS